LDLYNKIKGYRERKLAIMPAGGSLRGGNIVVEDVVVI
jgi:hypothetical protein